MILKSIIMEFVTLAEKTINKLALEHPNIKEKVDTQIDAIKVQLADFSMKVP